jgi:hypothetical protein
MCFLFSFIPATFWVTVGYFVLFSSAKTEGAVRKFGQLLAIWIFIVALFFPICGAYMSLSGKCPINKIIQKVEMRLAR